ncbi:MAG TPA: response regulator transcription factor [Cyclobacteriaceae bacterium]|nr:response regulator transcription factor [Cyclobacteriaceae bacterium]
MDKTGSGGARVLLADRQPLTAAGFTYLLSRDADFELIGEVQHRDNFAGMLEKHKPDLLVVDYNEPGYLTIADLAGVRDSSPATNILIISADNDKPQILEVLKLPGVCGYLTKSCSREEILMAVRSTAKGERFYCHKVLDILLEKSFGPTEADCDPTVLTTRETEILKLIASGKSTQQIAKVLNVSPHTIHSHRKSIIRKLNIKSPTEFVIQAITLGILDPEMKIG